jgi:hypothetical protein
MKVGACRTEPSPHDLLRRTNRTVARALGWVEKGRVVLRKTANPGYGVELAGDSQNERLQVRTIAFGIPGSPRDAVRDRDMETIWCDELDRLKTLLARAAAASRSRRRCRSAHH